MKGGSVYILMNKNKTVIYIGSTTDLRTRILQHKEKFFPKSFTAKYNVTLLVHFESFYSIEQARTREYQLKSFSRKKKYALIKTLNPSMKDLFNDIQDYD